MCKGDLPLTTALSESLVIKNILVLNLNNYWIPGTRPGAGALPKRASTPGSTQRTSGTSQHSKSR